MNKKNILEHEIINFIFLIILIGNELHAPVNKLTFL